MDRIVKLLAVIACGMFAGGGLMVGVSFGSIWKAMTPEQLVAGFPDYWLAFAWTIIPIALLKSLFLCLAVIESWSDEPTRWLWRGALALWLVNGAITSLYHLPIVFAALDNTYPAAELPGVVDQWLLVHWVREAIAIATCVLATLAAMDGRLRG